MPKTWVQKGYYVVHDKLKDAYRQGSQFHVKWKGFDFTKPTWEPVHACILGKDRVNAEFVEILLKTGHTISSHGNQEASSLKKRITTFVPELPRALSAFLPSF